MTHTSIHTTQPLIGTLGFATAFQIQILNNGIDACVFPTWRWFFPAEASCESCWTLFSSRVSLGNKSDMYYFE